LLKEEKTKKNVAKIEHFLDKNKRVIRCDFSFLFCVLLRIFTKEQFKERKRGKNRGNKTENENFFSGSV